MARTASCCHWGCPGTFKATAASLHAGVRPGFLAQSLRGDHDPVLLGIVEETEASDSHNVTQSAKDQK